MAILSVWAAIAVISGFCQGCMMALLHACVVAEKCLEKVKDIGTFILHKQTASCFRNTNI